jgi:hypothetical protein
MSGPQERKLRNRLIFKLTGCWPPSVVAERLSTPLECSPHVQRLIQSISAADVKAPCPRCGKYGDWLIIDSFGYCGPCTWEVTTPKGAE